ncbi:hypothetical protein [Thalassoroseus pseudoceratinae]|uniref:hypothetical protein n=1 Tax=Thalassoroseus pseudoceratinae TaxID=2713176 RepID=UPI00141FE322|nr:hypothetical protein [Thalassoroseus pseudoceratinae]
MNTNSNNNQTDNLNQAVLVLQIICASLMFGVVVFGGFTLIQKAGTPAKPPNLTNYALAEAIVAIPLTLLIPSLLGPLLRSKSQNNPPTDTVNNESSTSQQTRIAPLQIQKIIQYALLEGSAFLNLVAYYIECHPLGLVAVGIILVLMVLIFPTHRSVSQWLRRQDELALFKKTDNHN